ncbi:MAG: MarR family transcriptional regulator [Curvibacter sp.]|nr:MarR family transcriptional regulator [Curvibacter sp.]
MKRDFSHRFGVILTEAGRLYGRRFDQLARDHLTLTRAQCRALVVLAGRPPEQAMTQAALAEHLDVSAMAVATLCDRLEAAGLIRRQPRADDRRVNQLLLEPSAHQAIDAALALGDQVQAEALAGFSDAERDLLQALLKRIQANLGPLD